MAASASSQPVSGHPAVAPAWHTVIVLIVLFGFSFLGARKRSIPGMSAYGRPAGYVVVMVLEWGLTAFIWFEVRRRGVQIRELVGGRWGRWTDFLRDLGIAIAFMIICGFAMTSGIAHLLKASPPPGVRNLLPLGPREMAVYLLLALTAGFCEELIFRGYLQRQFSALTGTVSWGIALQGIAFGAAHGYQGWKLMTAIAIFGMTFGLLATWRRSLRPGMLAHFMQDGLGGLLGHYLAH